MGFGNALANAIGSGLIGAGQTRFQMQELQLQKDREARLQQMAEEQLRLQQEAAKQNAIQHALTMAVTRAQTMPPETPLQADAPFVKETVEQLPGLFEKRAALASKPILPSMQAAQGPTPEPTLLRRETPQEGFTRMQRENQQRATENDIAQAKKIAATEARAAAEDARRTRVYEDPKFKSLSLSNPIGALRFLASQGITADPALQAAAQMQNQQVVAGMGLSARTENPGGKDYKPWGGGAALDGLSPADKTLVEMVAYYQKQPPGNYQLGRDKSGYWKDIITRAKVLNPSWDERYYALAQRAMGDYNSGKTFQNVRSLNTALGHMGVLADAAEALKTGDLRLQNEIVNYVRTELGHPEVNNFNAARTALAGESATTFKGIAGSDPEIAKWYTTFNPNGSPEQQMGPLREGARLMASRLKTIYSGWYANPALKGVPPPEMLYPEGKQTVTRFGMDPKSFTEQSQSGEGNTPTTPDAASTAAALIKKYGGQ